MSKDDLQDLIDEETKKGAVDEEVEKKEYGRLPGTNQDNTPPMENVPLFGEDDLIINALEFELSEVKADLSKAIKAKHKSEILIDELKGRRNKMEDAITIIYDRHADDKVPEPTEPKPEDEEEPEGFNDVKDEPKDDPPEEVTPED